MNKVVSMQGIEVNVIFKVMFTQLEKYAESDYNQIKSTFIKQNKEEILILIWHNRKIRYMQFQGEL